MVSPPSRAPLGIIAALALTALMPGAAPASASEAPPLPAAAAGEALPAGGAAEAHERACRRLRAVAAHKRVPRCKTVMAHCAALGPAAHCGTAPHSPGAIIAIPRARRAARHTGT